MKKRVLTVVIPCYNEEKTIAEIVERVEKADSLGLKKEIIVVDDKSKDKSRKILKEMEAKKGIVVVYKEKNEGKGSALKTGFLKSKGDVVLVQDADLEYDPSEYPVLLEPILADKADVVYGSRFQSGKPHRVVYYWHALMNKMLTMMSNIFTNIDLTDMETCYKVFRGDLIRKIAPKLESERFGFEPEITARLSKVDGIRFYEVGISYYGRTYKDGKKITWKDGCKAIYEIFYYNVLAK